MPAKLPDETIRVNWRIRADDVELLRLLYPPVPGEPSVNEVVRDVVHMWCDRLRERHFGGKMKP